MLFSRLFSLLRRAFFFFLSSISVELFWSPLFLLLLSPLVVLCSALLLLVTFESCVCVCVCVFACASKKRDGEDQWVPYLFRGDGLDLLRSATVTPIFFALPLSMEGEGLYHYE